MTVESVAFFDPLTKNPALNKPDVGIAAAELIRPLASSKGTVWWVKKGIKTKGHGTTQG